MNSIYKCFNAANYNNIYFAKGKYDARRQENKREIHSITKEDYMSTDKFISNSSLTPRQEDIANILYTNFKKSDIENILDSLNHNKAWINGRCFVVYHNIDNQADSVVVRVFNPENNCEDDDLLDSFSIPQFNEIMNTLIARYQK